MYQPIKVELKLNNVQKTTLNKVFGCCRKTYNLLLDIKDTAFKINNENLDGKKLSKIFRHEILTNSSYSYLKEFNSNILQTEISNLMNAYSRYFKKIAGHPNFKSKANDQSAKFTKNAISDFNLDNGKLNLTKNIFDLKFRCSNRDKYFILDHRKEILSITISRKNDKYFAAILFETKYKVDDKPIPETTDTVGIDLGINNFLYTSKEEIEENKHFFKSKEAQIANLQKKMSKCEKGSNNRKKLNKQLNKIYTKIRNRKIDNLHKITTQLVKENQIISIEDLDVSEMLSNHKLAKAIQEMNFYEFRVLLDYKCIKYNRNLMIVDRYFPSTKKCSGCGHINHNMTLSDRVFICPICGLIINRDKNASINIDKEGVRLYNNPDEYTKVLEKRKERNQKNLETTIVKSEVKKKEKTLKKKNKNITPNKGKGGVSTC